MATRRTKTTRKNHRAGLYRELETRGYVTHGQRDPRTGRRRQPCGGVHLRMVKPEMVDQYLGDDKLSPGTRARRDHRSFPTKNSKGQVESPLLTYWTFVNFSQSYRAVPTPRIQVNG